MTRRILVLNGRPGGASFCRALAERYAQAAIDAGHEVRLCHVDDLGLDLEAPDYGAARASGGRAPGWAGALQDDLAWCEHWTIVTPMWWGGPPAALKTAIDRTLLPGFAFRYGGGPNPQPLLRGRTARVLLTSDTPAAWYDWVMGRPLLRQFKVQIFELCGLKPARFTHLSPLRASPPARRERWLTRAAALGAQGR